MKDAKPAESRNVVTIEGRNPVWEALKAERPIEKLLLAQDAGRTGLERITGAARRLKIKIEYAPREKLDRISVTGRHQGVIALAAVREYDPFETTLDEVLASTPLPLIVVLDEIVDPYNLGAIIRSAECAGAGMVVTTAHNSAGLTPATERSSAGAVAHMKICKVNNLAHALDYMKERGIWVAGADMGGQSAWKCDLNRPLALVIGSEGNGIRRLVAEKCDYIVSLPLKGKVSSLNASVAAGILIYETLRQRES